MNIISIENVRSIRHEIGLFGVDIDRVAGGGYHAGMSALPASEEELRLAIQSAVRSVADDFRLRARQAPSPAPVSESGPEPDPLAGQTILLLDAPPPAQQEEGLAEVERDILEQALGIGAPPAPPEPPPPPPPAPAPVPAAAPSPVREAPLMAVEPPSAGARLLIFSWTALIRVLSILDLAVPASLRRHKSLLGRIGMALTSLSAAFLVGMVLAKLLRRSP